MSAGDATGDVAGDPAGWVCVGVIGKPRGVRGALRVNAYTEVAADIAAYGPLYDGPGGARIELHVGETVKAGVVVATVAGIADRDAAAALTGTRLYVPRQALPEAGEEEFYHADLVGLAAETADGTPFGTVLAVHDFGAGTILEITPAGGGETILLPFNHDAVPEIHIAARRLVVAPPAETGKDDENEPESLND